MPDYKKMYFQLSAKAADAVDILVKAQKTPGFFFSKEPGVLMEFGFTAAASPCRCRLYTGRRSAPARTPDKSRRWRSRRR
ncbi:MAG TPA: hypothetical protein DD433_12090 [Ruminococcaceae bacterium]|nr:hypothetical protein [Oscillospiraceae bacterium]